MLKNRALYIAAGIIIAFAVCFYIVPYETLKRWLDAGRVGIWGVVWAITLNLAFTSFLERRRTGGQVVAIALNLVALIILVQAIWIPAKREFDMELMTSQLIDCLVVLGFIVSGASFLMPIGNTIGVTPPRNWWFLLFAGVVGALFAGIMIGAGMQTLSS